MKKEFEQNENEALNKTDVSSSLILGVLEIGLIDKDGDFKIEIDDDDRLVYKYIDREEAKKIIKFLSAQI
jgi:hypothetical protein